MGYRNGAIPAGEESGVSGSVNEALLFTTMCIIGHPVDVHVKDGSIYSGTLYTANVDNAYAVVLHKARRVKKGNRETNVAEGKLIDTLVILSEDLVQVIAKEILLPADGICGKAGADFGSGDGVVNPKCEEIIMNSSNHSEAGLDQKDTVPSRQGCNSSDVMQSGLPAEPAEQAEGSRLSLNAHGNHPAAKEMTARTNKVEAPSSVSYVRNRVPRPDDPHARHTFEASRQSLSEKGNHDHATIVKESKLNPKAKLFSPSPAQHISATPTPPLVRTPPNLNHASVAAAEPEVDVSSVTYRSSVPAKLAAHNNLFPGHGRNDIPYGQHLVGHTGSRMPPVRYASQYSHLQAGPPYPHPSSQTVMAGRMGPLIYVHPVSNDVTQGAAGFSQVSSRPLMAPQQINMPKHQGSAAMQALQLYMTPPFIANGHQTFAMPTYIPVVPPIFPVAGPIPVPGSDVSFGTKFA
ncbi:OLC1v1022732C2 [Oldenlandia corymbosa var. corymbosa]|uniref:OLC1v1022732C2 n=2 Tax=Oldenlandia corymbosa var. corymbosa TaxID=529605 RepID=A0AAV1BZ74_OLDCO|nr:OLC1v1022732C2 [Oldenlandia corymbosa var. corymbosa]